MMLKKILLTALVTGFCWSQAHAADFALVGNAEISVASEDEAAALARRLLLKEQKSWPDGQEAFPLLPKEGSPAYNALLGSIVKMTPTEFSDHWLRLKQLRGETPPRTVGSKTILLRLVSKKAGGFTVIPAEGAQGLPAQLKVLATFAHN